MKDEKLFETYLDRGPDELSSTEVRAALDWRDNNQPEAYRLVQQRRASQRESEERETLRHAWLADGGTEDDFNAVFPTLIKEHRAAKLREYQQEASRAATALIRNTF